MRIIVFFFLFFHLHLISAQNWCIIESERFRYFITSDSIDFVDKMDAAFTNELRQIEKRISYYLNGKLDVFFVHDNEIYKKLTKELPTYASHSGGSVVKGINSVILDMNLEPKLILDFLKKEVSRKIISEMLYGGSLQDMLKYDQGGYLPGWLMDGLFTYLSVGWNSELDAEWRNVYEKNSGFNVKNHPNNDIHQIRGASFWHFVEQEYGTNTLSSLLYFSRLTRKFSKALHYVLRSKPQEINKKWLDFYANAYDKDFSKRIPVFGVPVNKNVLMDYHLFDDQSIIILKNSWLGYRVFQVDFETNKVVDKYKLPKNTSPLLHSDAAMVNKDGKIHMAVRKGAELYEVQLNGRMHRLPMADVKEMKSIPGGFLILESNQKYSKVYFKPTNSDLCTVLHQINGFVSSVDSLEGVGIAFSSSSLYQYELILKRGNVLDTLLSSASRISSPYFYSANEIIFNYDKNGIVNGSVFDLQERKVSFLTDYRTNIISHKFKNDRLLELISVGKKTFLFRTNYMGDTSLMTLDSISPSFFFKNKIEFNQMVVLEPDEIKYDSSAPYQFVSPVPSVFDFTLTQYDSLNDSKPSVLKEIGNLKQSYYTQSFFLQLNNRLIENNQIAFAESGQAYLPSNLSLFSGSVVVNQNKDKHYFLGLNGLTRVGNRDFIFKGVHNRKIQKYYSIYYRNRRWLDIESRSFTNFSTIIPKIGFSTDGKGKSAYRVELFHRTDQRIPMFSDQESLAKPNIYKGLTGVNSSYLMHWKNDLGKSLRGKVQWNPYISQGLNQVVKMDIQYFQILNTWSVLKFYSQAGISHGKAPNVFLTGGANGDVLSRNFLPVFNANNNPALYEFVYGIRGFDINQRNGDKFFVYNIDFDISPFQIWAGKTFWDQFVNSVNLHIFSDGGIAFFGKNMYAAENIYSVLVMARGNDYELRVRNFENPFLISFGGGVSFVILNYQLKLELAQGLEFGKLINSRLHITLGKTLFE